MFEGTEKCVEHYSKMLNGTDGFNQDNSCKSTKYVKVFDLPLTNFFSLKNKNPLFFKLKSSRLDTDSMLTSLLTWASGESETKGKAGKESWSNLMI